MTDIDQTVRNVLDRHDREIRNLNHAVFRAPDHLPNAKSLFDSVRDLERNDQLIREELARMRNWYETMTKRMTYGFISIGAFIMVAVIMFVMYITLAGV